VLLLPDGRWIDGLYNTLMSSADRLPDDLSLGTVRLQVGDLGRSLAYYRDTIGLRVLDTDSAVAMLGVEGSNRPLIELRERAGVNPVPKGGMLGLFHFAILLPSRPDLGRFVQHLSSKQIPFLSSDHLVSEAIYLWDPDHLGVEVYADRPRSTWQTMDGELVMATEPLDLSSLAAAAGESPWAGVPAGTMMGHMHLSVSSLGTAHRLFVKGLGFDVAVSRYPGALFLAAGGYHHHLGTNTWARNARAATPEDARLLEWELQLPDEHAVESVARRLHSIGHPLDANHGLTDPWGTRLQLHVARSN
jgi:catechol 2,3-dioxygenase